MMNTHTPSPELHAHPLFVKSTPGIYHMYGKLTIREIIQKRNNLQRLPDKTPLEKSFLDLLEKEIADYNAQFEFMAPPSP